MAKKHKHEEHENHERWLVSYADFITLLFAFFVVLYASSRVDNNKLAEAQQSVRWALNFKGEGGVQKLAIFKGPPTEGGCVANMGAHAPNLIVNRQVVENLRKRIDAQLKPFLLQRPQEKTPSVVVEIAGGKLKIRLAAARFFDAASASLRPEAMPVLDAIADEVAPARFALHVEGHTDDSQVASAKFRNNWDLSAARAATVVTFLELAHRVEPARLTASGLGSARPLVPNDSPEHREQNRRIEITLELAQGDPLEAAAQTP